MADWSDLYIVGTDYASFEPKLTLFVSRCEELATDFSTFPLVYTNTTSFDNLAAGALSYIDVSIPEEIQNVSEYLFGGLVKGSYNNGEKLQCFALDSFGAVTQVYRDYASSVDDLIDLNYISLPGSNIIRYYILNTHTSPQDIDLKYYIVPYTASDTVVDTDLSITFPSDDIDYDSDFNRITANNELIATFMEEGNYSILDYDRYGSASREAAYCTPGTTYAASTTYTFTPTDDSTLFTSGMFTHYFPQDPGYPAEFASTVKDHQGYLHTSAVWAENGVPTVDSTTETGGARIYYRIDAAAIRWVWAIFGSAKE